MHKPVPLANAMMEIDDSEGEMSKKCDLIRNLSGNGALQTSLAMLSGSSRIIPSLKDFYFYHNFPEFKNPVEEIDGKSKYLLEKVGASERLFGKTIPFPDDKDVELDDDVGLDWLVTVNDEILERLDASLDEFKCLRKEEEKTGVRTMRVNGEEEEEGFQMVLGKKNKKTLSSLANNSKDALPEVPEVKMATKMKAKVPFHIPTIRKPQEEYKIIVNNSYQPFQHVWLDKSYDELRFLHPLEKHSFLEFVDKSSSSIDPVKPLPIEVTPFKFVEEIKDLKQLVIKLRSLDEFAVDLEHNQYRSFQGLTCLMQISTRTEDFAIDTLKLRVHIGPHLREIFKDPTKRKVMHGADSDIMWLQRDFGIYVCNMFDTGQASRVLKMERNSLEYLLNHFCGVAANKEYQNADWRIRPLPKEMIKYAREDTHYLLYIYDLMRMRLIMSPEDSESSDPPLVEVYRRSYDICTRLYEKELLTDTSYLFIYGLQDADLSAEQLAVISALYRWRDGVARAEDESTGYVLPNRTLIEIAKHMPLTTGNLRRILKSKHPYIDRNLGSIVSIIRNSIPNAPEFEEVSKSLKERRLELASERNTGATKGSEFLPSEDPEILNNAVEVDNIEDSLISSPRIVSRSPTTVREKGKFENMGSPSSESATSHLPPDKRAKENCETGDRNANSQSSTSVHLREDTRTNLNPSHVSEATVELLKNPSRGFGALFTNSAKRKIDPDKREHGENKLEKIQASVALPFHSFSGSDERHSSDGQEPAIANSTIPPTEQSNLGEKTEADSDSDLEDGEDVPMSLNELSSNFKKIVTSHEQKRGSKKIDICQSSEDVLHVEPFDYEAARNQIIFGENRKETSDGGQGNSRKKERKQNLITSQSHKEDGTLDLLQQGKRRLAFPASGNRSASFR